MLHDKKILDADIASLLARLCLSAIFIYAGIGKIVGFDGNVAYAAAAGVPFPELAIWVAMIIELVGGFMILSGYLTRYTSAAFVVFLVVLNAFFHMNFADQLQLTMFLKNTAILGGMLMLIGFGPGAYSVDHRLKRPKMDSM